MKQMTHILAGFVIVCSCVAVFGPGISVAMQAEGEGNLANDLILTFTTEQPPPPAIGKQPLDIYTMYDAVMIADSTEPFNIQAGVNDEVRFIINGTPDFTVVLTAGSARTARDVANDLNADPIFDSVARAGDWGGQLIIISKNAEFGSIQVVSVGNDAYGELGLTVGAYEGPSGTPEQRAVIEAAVEQWEEVIEYTALLPNPYSINIAIYPLYDPGSTLAYTNVDLSMPSGTPLDSRITFDDGRTWFVDPTPWDDSEFDPDGYNGPPGTDLLSVARHELGHALGWYPDGTNIQDLLEVNTTLTMDLTTETNDFTVVSTATFPETPATIRIGSEFMDYSLVSPEWFIGVARGTEGTSPAPHSTGDGVFGYDNIVDPSRLRIDVIQAGAHAGPDHPADLMRPGIGASRRRAISMYPTASYLARAHDYDITVRFMDANHTGTQWGSADYPWATCAMAQAGAYDRTILMTPGAYVEAGTDFTFDSPNTYTAMYGSAVVTVSGAR